MDKILQQDKKTLGGIIILIILITYTGYSLWSVSESNLGLNQKVNQLTEELESTKSNLDVSSNENYQLSEALVSEQKRNDEFENQISRISGTVGDLEKLSKTDPELLQKYSKVYFLNEHYSPPGFKTLSTSYISNPDKTILVHDGIWSFLKDLMNDAEEDGVNLKVVSAFRSFNEQASLKSEYSITYGSGANQFSADQGYSEHQLGTTLDFTTKEIGSNFTTFAQSEAYKWLQDNAYRYGFVLSYPKNNNYYIFEPWHWRFVGKDLAKKLYRKDQFFYDWDQRDIDEYLIDFFD